MRAKALIFNLETPTKLLQPWLQKALGWLNPASSVDSIKINLRKVAILTDGEIALRLHKDVPANPARGWVRALQFRITPAHSTELLGEIDLRLDYTMHLVRYGGHIGYAVKPQWRGHHYAGKACRLLRPVAIEHGMDVIWITCNPDNWPSRRTCEWLGATLVETVDLPPDNEQYKLGDRRKCRYRWVLY
jgi:tagatose 1,6-diphosphate aldolase